MLCFYILGWIKAYVRPQPVKVIELLEGELVQNAPGFGVFFDLSVASEIWLICLVAEFISTPKV